MDLLSLDEVRTAKRLGLHYVTNSDHHGVTRARSGKTFTYSTPSGQVITHAATLKRIASLVIPPAWEQVWISPDPKAHIQATGRDAKGRKQYRYHPAWRSHREAFKFGRMVEFGEALDAIRSKTSAHLRARALTRTKVLATVVTLLERTLIRVGNEEYARVNHHYGLTTLRTSHVTVKGARLHFEFVGKSGQRRVVDLEDPRLARIVRQLRAIPGRALFQYLDAQGRRRIVTSGEVNEYLREISGTDFTAKNFRTWAATVMAAELLCGSEGGTSERALKRCVAQTIRDVSTRLGNTPAVCRRSYVHPEVLGAFGEAGLTLPRGGKHLKLARLTEAERSVLAMLSAQVARSRAA